MGQGSGEGAETQTRRKRRLNCPGVLGKGSLHIPRPCGTPSLQSLLPLEGEREHNSMRDLNPNVSLPLTICGLLGKVFNVSFVKRESTESPINVNIKFLS